MYIIMCEILFIMYVNYFIAAPFKDNDDYNNGFYFSIIIPNEKCELNPPIILSQSEF